MVVKHSPFLRSYRHLRTSRGVQRQPRSTVSEHCTQGLPHSPPHLLTFPPLRLASPHPASSYHMQKGSPSLRMRSYKVGAINEIDEPLRLYSLAVCISRLLWCVCFIQAFVFLHISAFLWINLCWYGVLKLTTITLHSSYVFLMCLCSPIAYRFIESCFAVIFSAFF